MWKKNFVRQLYEELVLSTQSSFIISTPAYVQRPYVKLNKKRHNNSNDTIIRLALRMENQPNLNTLFNNLDVRVIGPPEEPFFYASDIAAILDIKQVTTSIKNFNHTEIVSSEMRARYNLITYKKYGSKMRRDDRIVLFTENGVRRLLSNSRTPAAERLRSLLDDKKYYYNSIPEMKFVASLQKAFPGENIELQKQVLGYRIDLYFTDYNIAVEFDEEHHHAHIDLDAIRQARIETELKCTFVRARPSDDICDIIGEIYTLIMLSIR